jgi:hypothetical protein
MRDHNDPIAKGLSFPTRSRRSKVKEAKMIRICGDMKAHFTDANLVETLEIEENEEACDNELACDNDKEKRVTAA